MKLKRLLSKLNDQQGVSAVIIAVCLVVLLSFVALGVDVSHLVVARNQLQNAADAGALAGAGELYTPDGTSINTGANKIAHDTAELNTSEVRDGTPEPVEVNWTSGNAGEVQRGHWSFGLGDLPRGFYPNDSTDTVDLWGVTTEELDANVNFINAVQVIARRQNFPIASWFAGIFGVQGIEGFAEAVGWIGYAGTLAINEVDAPIAICEDKIWDGECYEAGKKCYDCNEGKFINDASGGQDEETGVWTSFEQHLEGGGTQLLTQTSDPCQGGTNASEVKPLVDSDTCPSVTDPDGVNPFELYLNWPLEVNNGQIDAAFNAFYKSWECFADDFMPMTLPVVDCHYPQEDPNTCANLTGAVGIFIVHMTQQPNYKDMPLAKPAGPAELDPGDRFPLWDPALAKTPISEGGVLCSTLPDPASRDECIWYHFANHYELEGADENPDRPPGYTNEKIAAYDAKTIYFLKRCSDQAQAGLSGGTNYGILAKIPVLVD